MSVKLDALNDCKSRLATIGYPIKWPNELFTLPADPITGDPSTYLIVEVMGGVNEPIEIGGGMWRGMGTTWVHILVPVDTGAEEAFTLGEEISNRFRMAPLEPIVYIEISDDPGDQGDDNGNYWRTSISATWRYQNYVQRS